MDEEILIKAIQKSYNSINFTERYRKIMEQYNDFNNRMHKVDKNEILKTLKHLGYNFKIFSPGQECYLEESISNFKYDFSFNSKNGIMQIYISIYFNNIKVKYQENFAFIYRALMGDMNLNTTAPKFKTYDEFKEIINSLLKIYEDFKNEFLKRMNE